MGNYCSCRISENDIITNIFNSMLVKNYQISVIYNEFIVAVKDDKIDHSVYTNFICNLINRFKFRNDHTEFYENLNINESDIICIKRIGILIIFLSDGSYNEKISYLEKHIYKYYSSDNIKDFITDWVYINTDYCLEKFISIDKEIRAFYSKIFTCERKQIYLNYIYRKYTQIKIKFTNDNTKKHYILYEWLLEVFEDLQGDRIREYLSEDIL